MCVVYVCVCYVVIVPKDRLQLPGLKEASAIHPMFPVFICLHHAAPMPGAPHLPPPLSSPALRIHLSSETKAVLEEFDAFELELRGDVEMKVREDSFNPRGSRDHSRNLNFSSDLGKWVCRPLTSLLFLFSPGQRQGSDLLAPGRAGM